MDIIYKVLVTALDEMKVKAVAAIEIVTRQLLENTCRKTEHSFDILRGKKGEHVEIV